VARSVEQTALDLCRKRPAWNITDEAHSKMIHRLADRIDWDLIDEIAETTQGVKTLRRLRAALSARSYDRPIRDRGHRRSLRHTRHPDHP
jgi:predicted NAD/FAD-binding protein